MITPGRKGGVKLDKATADTLECKAGVHKAAADAAADKATTDAYGFRADFGKLTVDSAEQKAKLEHATVDAARLKAGCDKAAADTAEFKDDMGKATDDTAESKAGFARMVVVSAKQRAELDKATADAAEYKAGWDKAAADADEFKAGWDKAAADAVGFKAGWDKAAADAVEFKAGFDQASADAVEFKAGWDKASAKAVEFKDGWNKAAADAADYKAGWDKAKADAQDYQDQMSKMAEDMSHVQGQLVKQQENYSALHDQHAQLLRQQEVLAAERLVALGEYKPKAYMDSGTPADKLLQMITDLLNGTWPISEDVLLLLSCILEARDIYQPWHLGKQLLETEGLEGDVGASLVYLVGDTETLQQQAHNPQPQSLQELPAGKATHTFGPSTSSSAPDALGDDADLRGMLMTICSAPTSHALGQRARSHVANRRRSSSMSVGLAAMPDILEDHDDSDLATCTGRASQLLQHLTMRSTATANERQSASTVVGVGASAAVICSSAAGRAGDISCCNTSGEDISQSTDGDDVDSSVSGFACVTTDSACGSQVAAGDGSVVSMRLPRPQAPMVMDHLEEVLASANEWQFDAFALNEASQGHPLSTLGYYLFHQQGVIKNHFKLKPTNLARFLRRIEEGYKANPYHNAMHAADDMQTLHVILTRGGLTSMCGHLDPMHMMACYVAAVVHDFEHGGLTNDFLVNSLDDLAVLYNDRSPLENHHLAAAFMIMRQSEFNFADSLSKADFEKFRKIVIELVLATDMKQHFSIVSHFTTVHRLNAAGTTSPGSSGSDPLSALLQSRRSIDSGSACRSVDIEENVLPVEDCERMLGLQMALKCADVGHVTAALPVHIRWVNQLEEEFFRQGDVERQNGMTISPLFDREQQGITKSQVGFFDIIIIPLFQNLSKVFHRCHPLLMYVMKNYQYWAGLEPQALEAEASAAQDGSLTRCNRPVLVSPGSSRADGQRNS